MVDTSDERMPEATPVNAASAGEEVLRYFWDLPSLDEATRVKAATSLVNDLAKSQQDYEASGAPGAAPSKNSGEKQAALDKALERCSPLVVYSLTRLVKGLSSGRMAARQGFALALTEVVRRLTQVSTEAVLGLMDIWLEASNSMKGSEARDALLGRAFGYSAIVRGGRADARAASTVQVATALVALLQSKAFLREVAAATLLDLIERLDAAGLGALLEQLDGLRGVLQSSPDVAPPEALLLALRLWSRLPADVVAASPLIPSGAAAPPDGFFTGSHKAAAGHPVAAAEAFFRPEHLRSISGVLRDTTASHPRLHSVWPTILALLVPGFTPTKVDAGEAGEKGTPGPGQLEALWSIVVEGTLFTSSHERKYLGFQLFTLLLPFLGPDQVPAVFSPLFRRSLVNSLSNADSHLHAAAKRAVDRMASFAEKAADPGLRVALAVALQRQGGIGFDRLTKTKTAADLLKSLDSTGIQHYFKHLQDVFAAGEEAKPPTPAARAASDSDDSEEEDEDTADGEIPAADTTRRWVIEQLARALALPGAGLEAKQSARCFLAVHAFFIVDPATAKGKDFKAAAKVQPPPSEAIRHLAASTLVSHLEASGRAAPHGKAAAPEEAKGAAVNGAPGQKKADPEGKAKSKPQDKVHEKRSENVALAEVVGFVASAQDAPGVSWAVGLPEPITAALQTLRALEAKVAKALAKAASKDAKGSKAEQLLALLQLTRWLQLYIAGDPENTEAELAEELAGVYKAAFTKAGKEEAGEAAWMDRMTDILLSLLAYSSARLPSVPLREAVEATFRAFCAALTSTGMQDLVRIITRSDSGTGEDQDVLEGGEESEADEDEEEEDEEDEEDDEDDEEKEDEPASERPEGMDVEGPEPSTSGQDADEDMNDEQMFRMDKVLAAVLRTQRDARGAAKSSREVLQNFKLRTLALLDVFSRAAPGSALVPAVLPDLLKALEDAEKPSGSRALAERLQGVIAKLCRTKPDQEASASLSAEQLAELLKRTYLIGSMSRSADRRTANASSGVLHYLLSIAFSAGPEHAAAAQEASKSILAGFFGNRKLRIQRKLIEDILRRHPGIAEALLPEIISHGASARTLYLQSEAVALLQVIAKLPQDRMASVAPVLQQQLPGLATLAASTAAGASFTGSAKHAVAIKDVAALLEAVAKVVPGDSLAALVGSEGSKAVRRAVKESHKTAATPKVATALGRLAQVFDVTLGPFEERGTHRTYQPAAKGPDTAAKDFGTGGPKNKSGRQQLTANGKASPKPTGKASKKSAGQRLDAAGAVEKSREAKEAVAKRKKVDKEFGKDKKLKKRRAEE